MGVLSSSQAIVGQVSIVQSDRDQKVKRLEDIVGSLLKIGAHDTVSRLGRCQKYGYYVLTSGAALGVSVLYTSFFPDIMKYSWVPKLGQIPLVTLQGLATIGYVILHFVFVREGFQKLWKAIEGLVASRDCFKAKKIAQESFIAAWAVLAASGEIFGVIYAQIDPDAQHNSPLPGGVVIASSAIVAITMEMAKARFLLAETKRLVGKLGHQVFRKKEDQDVMLLNDHISRVVRVLDSAYNFWLSASSEFRESLCDADMLRAIDKTDAQAKLLCNIVRNTPSGGEVALSRRPLHRVGGFAAGSIGCFCAAGMACNFTLFQVLSLSSIVLGVNEARRQFFTFLGAPAEGVLTSVSNSTLEPLIDMPMWEPFTVAPVNSGVGIFMIMLSTSSLIVNGLSILPFWSKEVAKTGLGGQVSLIFQCNPLGFRNNELFALSPLFFCARTFLALFLALGAGALYEGFNLMLIPSTEANTHLWIFVRAASALCAMSGVFTFSCNLMDSSYLSLIRKKGAEAKQALVAGVEVLKKLKTVLRCHSKNLDDSSLSELSEVWYDAPDNAPWLDNESKIVGLV